MHAHTHINIWGRCREASTIRPPVKQRPPQPSFTALCSATYHARMTTIWDQFALGLACRSALKYLSTWPARWLNKRRSLIPLTDMHLTACAQLLNFCTGVPPCTGAGSRAPHHVLPSASPLVRATGNTKLGFDYTPRRLHNKELVEGLQKPALPHTPYRHAKVRVWDWG